MAKQSTDIEAQLLQAIRSSGMTRYRLAKISGVSEGILSLFVNGHRSLTLPTAAKLAKALNLELRPKKKGRKNHG